MKAAVLHGVNDLRLEELPDPKPRANEVLVKVNLAGVCGTDVHMWAGTNFEGEFPFVPGHEWVGEVIEAGPEVRTLAVGDRVTGECFIPCHSCPVCRNGGASAFCSNHTYYGFQPHAPGGLAEYHTSPEERLQKKWCARLGGAAQPSRGWFEGKGKAEPKASIEACAKDFEEPDALDDPVPCGIEKPGGITRLFAPNFYFGREGDDPYDAIAFNRKGGAEPRAVFGTDIGHWGLSDLSEWLEEAHRLVEEDFRHFVFTDPASLHVGMKPDFFRVTAVERVADKLISGGAA